MTTACMGGWCRIRAKCPHYTQARRGPEDAERLCPAGQDGAAAEPSAEAIRARAFGATFPATNSAEAA